MTIGEVAHAVQPVVDAVPYIAVSISLVLFALAALVRAYAKWDTAQNAWDDRAVKLDMIAHKTSQAIDWLCDVGEKTWKGAEKTKELNARLQAAEKAIEEGRYSEALAEATGFYQAAKSKIEKIQGATLPFAPRPSIVINPVVLASSRAREEIGPDSPAVEN